MEASVAASESHDTRFAHARETLALQKFIEQSDGTFLGDYYHAEITGRPTIEPASWRAIGARPSYIIRYYR